jgi:hypothetical protein
MNGMGYTPREIWWDEMKDIPNIEKGRFRSLAFFTFNFLLMDCAILSSSTLRLRPCYVSVTALVRLFERYMVLR